MQVSDRSTKRLTAVALVMGTALVWVAGAQPPTPLLAPSLAPSQSPSTEEPATVDSAIVEPAVIEAPVGSPAVIPPTIVPEPAPAPAPFAAIDRIPDELEASRRELAAAAVRLEQRLNPATSFGAGWLEYLEWDGVQKQLAPGSDTDPAAASLTFHRLNSGAAGLELSEPRAVADALQRYMALATVARAQDRGQFIARQAKAIERLAEKASLDPRLDVYALEQRLNLLLSTADGAEAARAVRQRFARPNLRAQISTTLLQRMLASPGAECVNVDDCILGTRIRGTGLTTASLRVATLPSYDRARLGFTLSGNTRSQTRGVNGPVAIRSLGDTRFQAAKTVELTETAFRMLGANASATTNSRTQSISKIGGGIGSRLVERIAQGRVAEQRPRADSIAGSRAAGRVAQGFDERLNERLIEARQNFDKKLIHPLRRRGVAPRPLLFSTTSHALLVQSVQASETQLAARQDPPAKLAGELLTSVHESAASNLLGGYLSGVTLGRAEADGPTTFTGGVKPEWLDELKDESRPTLAEFKPWTLRFRAARPVSIGFQDGKVVLALHAAEITAGEKNYQDWDLISTYQPVRAGEGWALEREGEVEVLPTGFDPESGKRLPSQKGALRRNLQAALNDAEGRLPRRVPLDAILLDNPFGAVRALQVEQIAIDAGWLEASWGAF
ncbi:hypothetical protein [Botrimarina hoheduenensis]|uniref:Uncharacterized protein n=1 Tax=Botrimarina hoheduenensis TaxID=2528000 RepID=A0A5C5WAH2_9BACT|nr:hypothetical protein [Botrimarina hoheduenensis]TWT47507.1 hypothetical protein Pla111_11210 [Botrimarina hoheduenensis]